MDILTFLKTTANSRKIFGKREINIIEKQLFGLNLSQSEKNRLSRDIRKKFEFINEVSKFSKEFELKHGAIIRGLVEETKEIILESVYFLKIKKIVLFGSAIESKLTLRSDVDIAVYFKEITEKEALKFRLEISKKTNEKIDIQVYNVLPEKIKKEIDQKGKVIYERKN